MKRNFYILLFVLVTTGCSEKGTVVRDPENVNGWVYRTMQKQYLWSAAMKPLAETDRTLAAGVYFDRELRYRDDPSVPLAEDLYGDRFSSVVFAGKASGSRAAAGSVVDFGFLARTFVDASGGKVIYGQVVSVVPGSPAARAGLRRGDCFDAVSGEQMPLSQSVYRGLLSAGSVSLRCFYPEPRTVELARAAYEDDPVLFDSLYRLPQPVGYLVYRYFPEGNRFDKKLDRLFDRFREAGARTLILDLRYNGGGDLAAAVRLASLIARRDLLGGTFFYKERNRSFGRPADFEAERFLSRSSVTANADIENLYVLTSENTASASELVIHGLRYFYGGALTVIGKRTKGKNLGGTVVTSRRYEWELHPITFRVYDRGKVSGYEGGIVPDLAVEEVYYVPVPGHGNMGVIAGFGDAGNEPLLRAALGLIRGTASGSSFPPSGRLCPELMLPGGGLVEGRCVTE